MCGRWNWPRSSEGREKFEIRKSKFEVFGAHARSSRFLEPPHISIRHPSLSKFEIRISIFEFSSALFVQGDAGPVFGGEDCFEHIEVRGEYIFGELGLVPEAGFEDLGRIGPGLAGGFGQDEEFGDVLAGSAHAKQGGGPDLEAGFLAQLAPEGCGESLAASGETAWQAPLLACPEAVFEKEDAALFVEDNAGDPVEGFRVEEP